MDMEGALEMVIETILNFGQYPQPRRVGTFITTGSSKPKEFDLYEFLEGQDRGIEFADLLEYFIFSMGDNSGSGKFFDLRDSWEKRLTKILNDHLRDSELVRGVAEKAAIEEREDHR